MIFREHRDAECSAIRYLLTKKYGNVVFRAGLGSVNEWIHGQQGKRNRELFFMLFWVEREVLRVMLFSGTWEECSVENRFSAYR